jgi:hypothetical protein
MTIRSTVSRLLVAGALGAGLLVPMTAGSADAAPCPDGGISDPITGLCWAQNGGISLTGTGGTCQPGRLGLCLGALQNSQLPGANLPTNTSITSGRDSWP